MLLASIPVHENMPVIADQCANFRKFFPEAHLVLHVSKGAKFTVGELMRYLRGQHVSNCIVNPEQVATQWGLSILDPHLLNLDFIRSAFPEADKIIFHSSNDLLVRSGAGDFVRSRAAAFNHRVVAPGTFWWPGGFAWIDEPLRRTIQSLGGSQIIAGQLEGSFYPAAALFEVCDRIRHSGLLDATPRRYPREEVYLPSLAHALGVENAAHPYIFSEVHRFDRHTWSWLAWMQTGLSRLGGIGRAAYPRAARVLNAALFRSRWYAISRRDVDGIREGAPALAHSEWLNDGDTWWRVLDRQRLYGVKRIERVLDNPVRAYIRALPA